jgi:hypothetical protein
LSAPIGGAAAVETNSGVLLVGGATSASVNTTPTTASILDPTSNAWTTAAAIDQGRYGAGIGATGSNGPVTSDGYKYATDIFIYGGANRGQATASAYDFNPAGVGNGDSGTPPSMSAARYDFAYATDPATGQLYAIGGLNGSNQAIAGAERYDPVADAWSAISSSPQALYGASASSDGAGHILVFGGTNGAGTTVNTVYSYTIASDTWTALSAMPVAESGTAAVFGAYGQVYVIGGRTSGGAVANVYVYNPVTDQWAAQAPLPAAVYGAAAAIDANGNLDVIGGFNSAGSAVTSVFQSAALPAPVGLPAVPTVSLDTNWFMYDGTPHAATATAVGSDGVTPVSGTFTFTYNGTSAPPVNAGTYNVVATFTSTDPDYVNTVINQPLYIAQAMPTLSVSGGGTITYDGSPHPITAAAVGIDGTTPVSGTFSYTYNGSSSPPVNAGTYTAVANFTSSDPNYTNATASTTITIPDPTIPTGVTAVGTSTTSILVSWNPVAGANHYNVYEREVAHSPKGSGVSVYYVRVGSNITGTSWVFNGAGTFYVTSVSATGVESPRSAPAGAQPLSAPSLSSFLWNGAVMSSASVEVGQTLQVTLLGYGNPAPTYTMVSGPSTMSLDSQTGVVTYTPAANEAGTVSATFTATNSVGSSTATFSFQVLSQPTIVVTGGTFTFDGNTHGASAVAYATDGVTPIAGSFSFLYAPASDPTALSTAPYAGVGTYIVQAKFTSGDPNYAGGTGTSTIQIIPPAEVAGVLVDGSSWAPGYLASLQAAGLGNGTGYAIPVGSAAQLQDLPWTNIDQIRVVFNENVNVQEASLALAGLNVPQYSFSGFKYDPTTFTATWTLTNPIGADKLQIDLHSTGPAAVTDTVGDPLDGEWTDGASVFPSGDTFAGGDFDFAFNVLPGDANQDGVVNGLDISSILSQWHSTNSPMLDMNGDDIINGLEISGVASRWLQTLPAGGESAPAGASALSMAAPAMLTNSAATALQGVGPLSQQSVPDKADLGHPARLAATTSAASGSMSVASVAHIDEALLQIETRTLSLDDDLLGTLAANHAARQGLHR